MTETTSLTVLNIVGIVLCTSMFTFMLGGVIGMKLGWDRAVAFLEPKLGRPYALKRYRLPETSGTKG